MAALIPTCLVPAPAPPQLKRMSAKSEKAEEAEKRKSLDVRAPALLCALVVSRRSVIVFSFLCVLQALQKGRLDVARVYAGVR